MFMWGVARQIANTGEVAVAPEVLTMQPGTFDHLRGKDGRHYFPKGMSYSLALAPLCLLGDALAVAAGVPNEPMARAPYGMFAASIGGPLFAAIEVLLIFEICLAAGFGRRRSALAALGAGLGTLLWAGSKSSFSEPFMGMLITFQMFCLMRYSRSSSLTWVALAAGSFGLVFLSQPAMIALIGLPLWIAVCSIAWGTHRLRGGELLKVALAFGVPAAVCAAIFGWLNLIRYGSAMSTGYWSFVPHYIPIWEGAYGVFLSTGKSIFLYSPPLLLVAVGARAWLKRSMAVTLFPVLALVLFLALYGSLPTWHGDGAWGPRYFSPLTGVLAILAAGVLAPDAISSRANMRNWIGLATLGIAVQVVGVTTSTPSYFALLLENKVVLGDPNSEAWRPVLFDPQLSPVVGRARLLASRVGAALSRPGSTWTVHRVDGTPAVIPLDAYDVIDVWPLRARLTLGTSPQIERALMAGWMAMFLMTGLAAFVLGSSLTRRRHSRL